MDQKDLEKLGTEIRFFNAKKAEWLNTYQDKYVLIKGESLIDTFTTLDEAYNAGVAKFGTEPFFVKKIVKDEPPEELSSYHANVLNVRL